MVARCLDKCVRQVELEAKEEQCRLKEEAKEEQRLVEEASELQVARAALLEEAERKKNRPAEATAGEGRRGRSRRGYQGFLEEAEDRREERSSLRRHSGKLGFHAGAASR
jgi:hypothetical protein